VARAVALEDPGAAVRALDVLEVSGRAFRDAYCDWYLSLVRRAPAVWGYLYDRMDDPRRRPLGLRRLLDQWNSGPLRREVRDFDPGAIVCTHFLPAEVLEEDCAAGRLCTALGVAVTDLDLHRFWVLRQPARYFVARDEMAAHLAALGFPRGRVEVTGIPIDPRFATPGDRAALRAKHGVPATGAVVLLLGGGFGLGPVGEMARQLAAAREPALVVVVAGRNEALREELAPLAGPRLRVLGFTTEIDEWMALSDLLVTKPGGLSTAEALARGLPLVLANPIPGQEQRNADALLEMGAAVRANTPAVLAWKVDTLLASSSRLAAMREAALRAARPLAAAAIARWALTQARSARAR
jgi:processive 1,2-diacylglycerol beta-glucosyltransferase